MSHSAQTVRLDQSNLEADYVAPQNSTQTQLVEIWEQLLEITPISIRDNFFEIGGDSLLAVRLFAQIEQTFGKSLSLSTLLQSPTVEQLAGVLGETTSPSWSSLVPIQPNGSKPPFFCVHGNGANVLVFNELANHLGTEQPFYGLQARGVDGKEAALDRIEDMAAFYIQEMRTVQPQGPYFVGGFSSGGLVAYEIAQQLHAEGEQVAFLGLFDTFVPGSFPPVSNSERLARHWRNLFRLGAKYPLKMLRSAWLRVYNKNVCRLYQLFRIKWLNWPYERKRRYIGICIRRAVKAYVPQVYPGQVTLFRASEPPMGWYYMGRDFPTPDDWYDRDPQYGWGNLVGELESHDVSGHHGSMLKEPHVAGLTEKLRASLDAALNTAELTGSNHVS
ncbi:thioesterase domain-containing protein [Chroococcidiopsis thermalis]|uniref:Phosphopantetheine-binding protein n=1 Tax=Chroococcidiopsis thermalis (strain PCC 7203) TaxID=251229 RepID=K9TVS5_CHRTP|nr:thioesterase domain-containing protein [Chroococcidiopsis thermalis]AFY86256.1 phosphopantetheine-binding protein [Chroococcidiopsis thermalis PCC 7203]